MIVLDTNVLVAALTSQGGASFQLLSRALDRRLTYAISVALALEYEDVLTRREIRKLSWASEKDLQIVLDNLLVNASQIMPIRVRLRPFLRDPGDEMVLECAVQSGAESIVTMNHRDFAGAASGFRIHIESPGACLARLKMEGH